MANKKELNAIKESYKETFRSYLQLNDKSLKDTLRGKWEMAQIFLTHEEISRLENEVRANDNKLIIEYFENVESWTRQFEGKTFPFEWTVNGLQNLKDEFSWIANKEDYRKFILAVNLTIEQLEKVAA